MHVQGQERTNCSVALDCRSRDAPSLCPPRSRLTGRDQDSEILFQDGNPIGNPDSRLPVFRLNLSPLSSPPFRGDQGERLGRKTRDWTGDRCDRFRSLSTVPRKGRTGYARCTIVHRNRRPLSSTDSSSLGRTRTATITDHDSLRSFLSLLLTINVSVRLKRVARRNGCGLRTIRMTIGHKMHKTHRREGYSPGHPDPADLPLDRNGPVAPELPFCGSCALCGHLSLFSPPEQQYLDDLTSTIRQQRSSGWSGLRDGGVLR